jgi:lipid A 3-O-deacylase
MRCFLLLLFLHASFWCPAQVLRDPPLLGSVSLAYENDVLKAGVGAPTDYYYTGGTFVEFNHPFLKRTPVSKILPRLPWGYDEAFGISYNSLGFTPTNTESDSITYYDRPFAGTIYLGLNRVSCRPQKKLRLTSRFDVGAIGPVALAYETQKFIHKHTNNAEPRGWQFQIENDLYLNYSFRLEKGLIPKSAAEIKGLITKRAVEVIGFGTLNAGTIYSNASAGVKFRAGKFKDYFLLPGYSGFFQFWVYASGECKIVAYDATMQGGIFNRSSVYTIPGSRVERTVFLMTAGVVFTYHKFRFEYFNTFLTPEFEGGLPHAWGHFGVQYSFYMYTDNQATREE